MFQLSFTDQNARYWSKIAILLQLVGPRRNVAVTFGMQKLDGEKNVEDTITRFDTIHERDRQQDGRTDIQTPHDSTGRVYA